MNLKGVEVLGCRNLDDESVESRGKRGCGGPEVRGLGVRGFSRSGV